MLFFVVPFVINCSKGDIFHYKVKLARDLRGNIYAITSCLLRPCTFLKVSQPYWNTMLNCSYH